MTIVIYLVVLVSFIFMSLGLGLVFAFVPENFRTSIYMNAILSLIMFSVMMGIFFAFAKGQVRTKKEIGEGRPNNIANPACNSPAIYASSHESQASKPQTVNRRKVSIKQICSHVDVKRPRLVNIAILCIIGVVSIFAFILLQEGAIRLFILLGYNPPAVEGGLAMDHFGHYIMLVIAVAVFPAIWEEVIFRGLILQGLMKYGAVVAVIVSSLLFSLIHLSPAQTVYQFIAGIIWALVYLRTKNLTYPIILHFINNFFIVTYTFIMSDAVTGDADPMPFDLSMVGAMLIAALIGGLIIWGMLKLLRPTITTITKDKSLQTTCIPTQPQEQSTQEKQKFTRSLDFKIFIVVVIISMIIWLLPFIPQGDTEESNAQILQETPHHCEYSYNPPHKQHPIEDDLFMSS